MRTKFYLASLALAALAVGCQNDDFISEDLSKSTDKGLITLDENFVIASVDNDAETRTHWALSGGNLVNAFVPNWYTCSPTGIEPLSWWVYSDQIGLCWTGVSADGTGTSGDEVLTNYQFYHRGWLGKNQTGAKFDECTGELKNGWTYEEITANAGTYAYGDEVDVAAQTTASDKTYPAGTTLRYAEVNLNSGIYKTDNKAIFGGDYIAYYPYNADFNDKGCIPARAAMVYNDVKVGPNGLTDPALANATFRYSDVTSIKGGAQASDFGFHNLSGLIRLVVNSGTTSSISSGSVNVDQVVFYSPAEGIKTLVTLNATAIRNGQRGQNLYASVEEVSKSITVNVAADASSENLTIPDKDDEDHYIVIAALPTNISDLQILLHNKVDQKWATYSIGATEVKPSAVTKITQVVKAADFKAVYFASDQNTLNQALASAASAASATSKKTVKLLGDITLSSDTDIPSYVIVEGDDLIVPEGVTLTLKDKSEVKSNIEIQGQTCCGTATAAGALVVNAATMSGDVHAYNGYDGKESATITFVSASSSDAVSYLNSTGSLTIESDVEVVIEESGDFNVKGAVVDNYGKLTVKGKFAMLDASGSTVAAAGRNFTNYEDATFVDKIGSTVGGATQYMNNDGNYICELKTQARMDEAYTNKKACNIINVKEVTAATTFILRPTKHNSKNVDIWVSSPNVTFTTTGASYQTVGNVTVGPDDEPAGDLTIASAAKIVVDGNIVVNKGSVQVQSNVANMQAANVTINRAGSITYAARTGTTKTMTVAGTYAVYGTFTLTSPSATEVVAYVTCTRLVEGGTFIGGKPEVVE